MHFTDHTLVFRTSSVVLELNQLWRTDEKKYFQIYLNSQYIVEAFYLKGTMFVDNKNLNWILQIIVSSYITLKQVYKD